MGIEFQAISYLQPIVKQRNDLFSLIGVTTLRCSVVTNLKKWLIFKVNPQTGMDLDQVYLINNPTINYAQLVIQPQTLDYGLHRFVYTVTMTNTNKVNSINSSVVYSSEVSTYVQIDPSGLVISSLSLSQGMYGGTIEISRGSQQSIDFNPYLNSFDIDAIIVITTLNFKYSCQIIDSNIPTGYPNYPSTNNLIYLDEMKVTPSLLTNNNCFNSTDSFMFTDNRNNLLTIKAGTWPYLSNRKYEIYLSTIYNNVTYFQYTIVNIEPSSILPISQIE